MLPRDRQDPKGKQIDKKLQNFQMIYNVQFLRQFYMATSHVRH